VSPRDAPDSRSTNTGTNFAHVADTELRRELG
jgi:hypothetical protein